MAQVEHYKGKLGFEHRSEEKLTLALTGLLDALEEFGHPALQINARDPHRIGLDTDHYQISLRLRRMPLRLGVRAPKGLPAPAAYIELTMTPNFEEACDQEVSEILLAMILQRLAEATTPLVVFWQDSLQAIPLKDFLAAFDHGQSAEHVQDTEKSQPLIAQDAQDAVLEAESANAQSVSKDHADTSLHTSAFDSLVQCLDVDPKQDADHILSSALDRDARDQSRMSKMTAQERRLWLADQARAEAEAERARGRALFGSVERATPVLEQHCDEILQGKGKLWLERNPARARSGQYGRSAGLAAQTTHWAKKGLMVPAALLAMVINSLRAVDLAVSMRAAITAVVVLFLHGSGMVQAAARAFLP